MDNREKILHLNDLDQLRFRSYDGQYSDIKLEEIDLVNLFVVNHSKYHIYDTDLFFKDSTLDFYKLTSKLFMSPFTEIKGDLVSVYSQTPYGNNNLKGVSITYPSIRIDEFDLKERSIYKISLRNNHISLFADYYFRFK